MSKKWGPRPVKLRKVHHREGHNQEYKRERRVRSSWAGEGVGVASFGLWSSFGVVDVFGKIDKYRSPSSAQAK